MYNSYAKSIEEVSKINILTKQDEENRISTLDNDQVSSKLRAIFNVDPQVQASMYEYTDLYPMISSIFEDPFEMLDAKGTKWVVHLVPCSQKAPHELERYMPEAILAPPGTIYLLVSGDDTTILLKDEQNQLHGDEGDVNACDTSITKHMGHEFLVFLKAAGLIELAKTLKIFYDSVEVSYTANSRITADMIKLFMKFRYQTFSGEFLTTIKNTVIIMITVFMSLKQVFSRQDAKNLNPQTFLADSYKMARSVYGIDMEHQYYAPGRLSGISFLRCWWIKDIAGQYRFIRLPSAIGTLGKTRRNWIHGTPNKDQGISARYCMYALARSHQTIPRNTPLIGPLFAMADRVSLTVDLESRKMNYLFPKVGDGDLKFQQFNSEEVDLYDLDNDAVAAALKVRYNVTLEELEPWNDYMESITFANFTPSTILQGFPVIHKIMDVDYGQVKYQE
jgi:hypothetical protein